MSTEKGKGTRGIPLMAPRRSSARPVRQPRRFDDEPIPTPTMPSTSATAMSPPVVGPPPGKLQRLCSTRSRAVSESGSSAPLSPPGVPSAAGSVKAGAGIPGRKRKGFPRGGGSQRKLGRGRNTSNIGRWKPTDDLQLINGVLQTNDLSAVHIGVKFTCKFTLHEISERWHQLMYDQQLSKLAQRCIERVPATVVSSLNSLALFSKAEEDLLSKIPSTAHKGNVVSLGIFEDLLSSQPAVFFPGRTARSLMAHWCKMKHFHLLEDQKVYPILRILPSESVEDVENVLSTLTDDVLEREEDFLLQEALLDQRATRRTIHRLEKDVSYFQSLIERIPGLSQVNDFDHQTVAMLRGENMHFKIRGKEVTIGRGGSQANMINLSLEGPALKISRKQAVLRLNPSTGQFTLSNQGKRVVFINGLPLLSGMRKIVPHNSLIEFGDLRFLFLMNHLLVGVMRRQAAQRELRLMQNNSQQESPSPPSTVVAEAPSSAPSSTSTSTSSSATTTLSKSTSASVTATQSVPTSSQSMATALITESSKSMPTVAGSSTGTASQSASMMTSTVTPSSKQTDVTREANISTATSTSSGTTVAQTQSTTSPPRQLTLPSKSSNLQAKASTSSDNL